MPGWYDSVKDETMEEFESPGEVEIRVADGAMITANRTVLRVRYKADKALEVSLKVLLDRSQVYRASKKTNFFGLKPMELVEFDPNAPLVCELNGGADLIERINAGLKEGREVAAMVTEPGKDGFPVFFDVDNYTLHQIYQVKE